MNTEIIEPIEELMKISSGSLHAVIIRKFSNVLRKNIRISNVSKSRIEIELFLKLHQH